MYIHAAFPISTPNSGTVPKADWPYMAEYFLLGSESCCVPYRRVLLHLKEVSLSHEDYNI